MLELWLSSLEEACPLWDLPLLLLLGPQCPCFASCGTPAVLQIGACAPHLCRGSLGAPVLLGRLTSRPLRCKCPAVTRQIVCTASLF